MEIIKHYASFSEAIRQGALLRPQCRELFFADGGSCAFGAGMEAVSGKFGGEVYATQDLYPYLRSDAPSRCPTDRACSIEGYDVTSLIFHLNDDHNLSREQIADWLQEYEDSIGYVTLIESESAVEDTQPVASASALSRTVW